MSRTARANFGAKVLICMSLTPLPAAADPWIAPGDARLRHDLQLLSDAGIVRAPLSAWPVSWGEVARDLRAADVTVERPPHVEVALARARAAAAEASRIGAWQGIARIAGSENPMQLRRFADVAREEGEITGGAQVTAERYALRFQATAVANASDGQDVRADGSYAGMVLGNWIVSAGLIDRWWGPGWEGSLIYGTNARPMPAVTLERNFSDPFEHPWLAWLGQWRFVTTMGQFESGRDDVEDPLFYAARLTVKPHPRLEVGLSRSAQWCGDGRPCGLDTFWDLWTGNDNDQALADQPGNQLGGVDIRWSLPWAPVAAYVQAIGEDEANSLPYKFLGLVGAELWGGWGERSWRAHLEYANTTCNFYGNTPEYGCAYTNSIFTDGYQYRDRALGHAIDGDSKQLAVGAMLVNGDGSSWEIAAQQVKVNRENANPVHSVSSVAAEIWSADVTHRRQLFGGDLKVGIGFENSDSEAAGGDSNDVRGLIEWTTKFQ